MSHIRFSLKFHAEHDAEVIKILNQQESINDYIRQLVRADGIMMSIIDDMAADDLKLKSGSDYGSSLKDPETIIHLIYEWNESQNAFWVYNPLEENSGTFCSDLSDIDDRYYRLCTYEEYYQ